MLACVCGNIAGTPEQLFHHLEAAVMDAILGPRLAAPLSQLVSISVKLPASPFRIDHSTTVPGARTSKSHLPWQTDVIRCCSRRAGASACCSLLRSIQLLHCNTHYTYTATHITHTLQHTLHIHCNTHYTYTATHTLHAASALPPCPQLHECVALDACVLPCLPASNCLFDSCCTDGWGRQQRHVCVCVCVCDTLLCNLCACATCVCCAMRASGVCHTQAHAARDKATVSTT